MSTTSAYETRKLLIFCDLSSLTVMMLLFPMTIIRQVSNLFLLIRYAQRGKEYAALSPEEWVVSSAALLCIMLFLVFFRFIIARRSRKMQKALDTQRLFQEAVGKTKPSASIQADLFLTIIFIFLALCCAIFMSSLDFLVPAFLLLSGGLVLESIALGKLHFIQRKTRKEGETVAKKRKNEKEAVLTP